MRQWVDSSSKKYPRSSAFQFDSVPMKLKKFNGQRSAHKNTPVRSRFTTALQPHQHNMFSEIHEVVEVVAVTKRGIVDL